MHLSKVPSIFLSHVYNVATKVEYIVDTKCFALDEYHCHTNVVRLSIIISFSQLQQSTVTAVRCVHTAMYHQNSHK